jgi:hypothetical protein
MVVLIRNRRGLGPYSRTMPRALQGSEGGGRFFMSEVPLYTATSVHSIRKARACEPRTGQLMLINYPEEEGNLTYPHLVFS